VAAAVTGNFDWAAISQAVQDFHDANGWWASWEQIQAMEASPPVAAQTAAAASVAGTVDWATMAAVVSDHHAKTGIWASYDDILGMSQAAVTSAPAGAAPAPQLEAAAPAAPAPQVEAAPLPAAGFSQSVTWAEEFEGASLDRGDFPIVYGGGGLYWNGAFRWDNSEVSVSGGSLHIGMAKQADGIWDVGGVATTPNAWHAGLGFTYGKVEIMAKVSQEVWGAGPAFVLWPTDGDWPPEVDILETPKGGGMFTNHWAGPDGGDRYETTGFEVDLAQWHVYGLEWTPDSLTMTLDGEVVKTITENIPHEEMAIALQGNVGSADEQWYGGSPNGSGVSHIDIAVDYVRYYDYIG
jgi:hypothetical protein